MGRRSRRIRERAAQGSPAPVLSRPAASAFASWREAALVLGIALILTVLAYSNALGGRFVYDDEKQIAANPLIQESRYFWKALGSDVWAFTGESGKAWSNYWRPVFITWLSWNWTLFGNHTTGWHVGNIVLHALATSLGYFVLRAIGARPEASAVVTWLFAAHPVHVESITWISGSPDPMVASFLFGAYLCHLAARRRNTWVAWTSASVLYACALLCKEIAIVFPAVVFLTEIVLAGRKRDPSGSLAGRALRSCLPYVGVAAVYMVVRAGLVGMHRIQVPGAPGLGGVVLSAPSILFFYLRHAFFPFGLGPSYPLKLVTSANVSFANFVLPLVVVAAVACGAFLLSRRDRVGRLALVWFLLPLAPVFDVRSFLPEDFVHDRYLYLPLFGALACAGTALVDAWGTRKLSAKREGWLPAWVVGLPLALLLAVVTRSYNRAWMDDVALWESGVRSNPGTAFPHTQLGEAYRKAGRLAEARRELERALELNPAITAAHVALGAVALKEGRLEEAEKHLKQVLDQYPDFGAALDQLGLVYQKEGKLDEAIAVFERGRRAIPYRSALYTVNIAVLEKLQNRAARAQSELESLGDQLETTTDPDVLRAWWYLGELYREQGMSDRALSDYEK